MASPLKDPRGGLTAAGRAYFKRKEGANLKPGVRGPANTPEKMRRKGSFLRRFYGRKVIPPLKTPSGKPTRYALAAHAWGEKVPTSLTDVRRLAAKGSKLLQQYESTRKSNPVGATLEEIVVAPVGSVLHAQDRNLFPRYFLKTGPGKMEWVVVKHREDRGWEAVVPQGRPSQNFVYITRLVRETPIVLRDPGYIPTRTSAMLRTNPIEWLENPCGCGMMSNPTYRIRVFQRGTQIRTRTFAGRNLGETVDLALRSLKEDGYKVLDWTGHRDIQDPRDGELTEIRIHVA